MMEKYDHIYENVSKRVYEESVIGGPLPKFEKKEKEDNPFNKKLRNSTNNTELKSRNTSPLKNVKPIETSTAVKKTLSR